MKTYSPKALIEEGIYGGITDIQIRMQPSSKGEYIKLTDPVDHLFYENGEPVTVNDLMMEVLCHINDQDVVLTGMVISLEWKNERNKV